MTDEFEPIVLKEFSSIAIQTDDYGCINGCFSMYIDHVYSVQSETEQIQSCGTDLHNNEAMLIIVNEGSSHANIGDQHSLYFTAIDDTCSPHERNNDKIGYEVVVGNVFENEDLNNRNDHDNNVVDDNEASNNNRHEREENDEHEVDEDNEDNCDNKNDNESLQNSQMSVDTSYLENTENANQVNNDNVAELTELSQETEQQQRQEQEGLLLKRFECQYCLKVFDNNFQLQDHCKMHVGDKPFVCIHCEKKFLHGKALKIHLGCHSGKEPFNCQHCDKMFEKKCALQRHVQAHNVSFECSHCDKKFSSKNRLREHLKIHFEKAYVCPACGAKYAEISNLNKHISKNHPGEKLYKCSECESAFVMKRQLLTHAKSHVKPHECCHCGKVFHILTRYKQHLRTHTKEKPFQCSYCDEKFALGGTLKRHIKGKHTKEKAFICSYCEKAFTTQYHLSDHIKFHTKVKPFVCTVPQCEKTYRYRQQLTNHMKWHYAPKRDQPEKLQVDLSCSLCNKTLKSLQSFKKHVEKHCPLKCPECEETFSSKIEKKAHIKLKHKKKKSKRRKKKIEVNAIFVN